MGASYETDPAIKQTQTASLKRSSKATALDRDILFQRAMTLTELRLLGALHKP